MIKLQFAYPETNVIIYVNTGSFLMPYYFFEWNRLIEEHLAENDVTTAEFELIVCDPESIDKSNSSDRKIAFGFVDGRFLACIYEMLDEATVLPVTAYKVE